MYFSILGYAQALICSRLLHSVRKLFSVSCHVLPAIHDSLASEPQSWFVIWCIILTRVLPSFARPYLCFLASWINICVIDKEGKPILISVRCRFKLAPVHATVYFVPPSFLVSYPEWVFYLIVALANTSCHLGVVPPPSGPTLALRNDSRRSSRSRTSCPPHSCRL